MLDALQMAGGTTNTADLMRATLAKAPPGFGQTEIPSENTSPALGAGAIGSLPLSPVPATTGSGASSSVPGSALAAAYTSVPLHLDKILKGDSQYNVELSPGDVVYVPQHGSGGFLSTILPSIVYAIFPLLGHL